mmetsp:Transcript_20586/g.27802  ORF Transcript_20586/g.27802 Transcript_20586/m.27802 type:complete len:174 (+) Transcript_20586:335-856(+)
MLELSHIDSILLHGGLVLLLEKLSLFNHFLLVNRDGLLSFAESLPLSLGLIYEFFIRSDVNSELGDLVLSLDSNSIKLVSLPSELLVLERQLVLSVLLHLNAVLQRVALEFELALNLLGHSICHALDFVAIFIGSLTESLGLNLTDRDHLIPEKLDLLLHYLGALRKLSSVIA